MMSFKRRAIVAAATVAGIAGAGLLVAAPANAATSDCPSSYTCIWRDSGYVTGNRGAGLVAFSQYIPNFGGWDYSGTTINANDSASSVYNNGVSETVYLYKDANGAGAYFTLHTQQGDGDLGNSTGYQGYNDTLSSGYYASFN